MGLMNIFSKKNAKEVTNKQEQVTEDYYTPVEEPVGELPVADGTSKFISEPLENINTSMPDIQFDDEKPLQILTTEQKELVDNGYYLTPNYLTESNNQVNPTTSLFESAQPNDDSFIDDELPYNNDDDDEDVFNSRVDGSYSSFNSNTYDEEKVNEHKFFSTSVDEIDNYKNQLNQNSGEKTKIIGDSNIFNINRIDDKR